jgi:probable F420-dependent oxidoreductase
MKVMLRIPMDVDDKAEFQNTEAVRAMAQAIDRSGVDACNVTDHPAPTVEWRGQVFGHDALDPFASLAFLAAATDRVKLLTALVILPYRNPFIVAKAATTVDILSNGRLMMGVGLGYLRGEYEAVGVDFDSRGEAMEEALEAIKACWTKDVVTFHGRRFNAVDIMVRPRPVQQPHPPLWMGGNSAIAIRRAAEHCDGWMPFWAPAEFSRSARTGALETLEDLKRKIGQLRQSLAKAGRTRPFDVAMSPQAGLDGRSPADIDRFVQAAGELAELGVNWIPCGVAQPNRQEFLESLQWLGEEVVPKLQAIGSAPLV